MIVTSRTGDRQGNLSGLKWGRLSLKNKGFEWMDEMDLIMIKRNVEEGKGNGNVSYSVEPRTTHGINVTRVISHEKVKRCADVARF